MAAGFVCSKSNLRVLFGKDPLYCALRVKCQVQYPTFNTDRVLDLKIFLLT